MKPNIIRFLAYNGQILFLFERYNDLILIKPNLMRILTYDGQFYFIFNLNGVMVKLVYSFPILI